MTSSEYSVLEYSRPVTTGAEQLLAQARYHGSRIFKDVPQSIVRLDEVDGAGQDEGNDLPPADSVQTIGEPRFKVYGKMMLPVLQLAAPTSENFHGALLRAAGTLSSQNTELRRAGLKYDINDQDKITVHCSNLTMTRPPHKDGIELAVVPDMEDNATQLFIEQADICIRALQRASKKIGSPHQRFSPVLPFALMPYDTTPKERYDIYEKLVPQLPLRLTLGWFKPPMVR